MAPGQRQQKIGMAWLFWLLGFSLCLAFLHFPDLAGKGDRTAGEAARQERSAGAESAGKPGSAPGASQVNHLAQGAGPPPLPLGGPQYPGLLPGPDVNLSALAINNRGQVVVEEKPGDEVLEAFAPPEAAPAQSSAVSKLTPDPEAVKKNIVARQQELCDEATFKAALSRFEAELASKNFSQRANQMPDSELGALIKKYARQHGVDARLVWAVMRQESGFNPRAVSPKGAMGLMQLIPSTAALMGVNDPFDPEENIGGGVKYLKLCLSRFNNNVVYALAAYNAGPDNVSKYQGCPPFAETRNYVLKVMRDYTGKTIVLPALAAAAGRPDKKDRTAPPAALAEAPQESGLDWKVAGAKFKVAGPNWKLPLRATIIMSKIPAAVRQNPEVTRLLAKQAARNKLLP